MKIRVPELLATESEFGDKESTNSSEHWVQDIWRIVTNVWLNDMCECIVGKSNVKLTKNQATEPLSTKTRLMSKKVQVTAIVRNSERST